jgi:hypothetical protein
MHITEFLNRTPPDVLYHYTTVQGLHGIFSSQEIWATHTQYLNDQREFRHAIFLAEEELAHMLENEEDGGRRQKITEMQKGLDRSQESINVCVCSFSAEGDTLSQWRAYGGSGGFAIGFSGEFLLAAAKAEKFWLAPCIYKDDEQRLLIRLLLTDVLDENLRGIDREQGMHIPGGNLVAYLNRYAPILKHHSFAEEREWRVVTSPIMCHRERFEYRAGKSLLIPYYRLALATEQRPMSVKRIVVGPNPHQKQAIAALETFLLKKDVIDVQVKPSTTPYRNW